jgi:small nuclear ribonucleoprotein (snRNP)-like protein
LFKIPVPVSGGSEGGNPDQTMNNKRKGRGGGGSTAPGKSDRSSAVSTGGPKRSKTPDKETKEQSPVDEFKGIYSNPRFTHALTSLIGVPLRVKTNTQDEYEGILTTFSPDFEMVLGMAHQIDPANSDTVDLETVKEKMVFPFATVVRYFAADVDFEFAMKETFQTDTQISTAKVNGDNQLRELEMWQPEDDCMGGGIEDDINSNSWTPEEMFAKNEERFGVKTSFDPSLTGYTVPLNRDRVDSETEMRAARIAASIEGDGKVDYYTALENGVELNSFIR